MRLSSFLALNHTALIVFTVLAAVFLAFPWLDIEFSRLFFRPDAGFFVKSYPTVIFIHRSISWIVKGYVASLIIIFVVNRLWKKRFLGLGKKEFIYLLVCLALGPGLLVNTVFKDNWHRARPSQITEFGGTQQFSPPFIISSQCDDNCSFVSGHASVGFYLVSFALLAKGRRQKQLATLSVGAGSILGLIRIAQGGHFLSDVIFSGFIVYFASRTVWNVVYGRH